LEEDYSYWGEQTCATDGLCATTCPVAINTGDYTKVLRSRAHTENAAGAARFVANNFSGVTKAVRTGLNLVDLLHRLFGSAMMLRLAGGVRSISSAIPLWTPWMPRGGVTPRLQPPAGDTKSRVVYFPSCVCRSMGPAQHDHDHRPLDQAVVALLMKAGFDVILPDSLDQLCCGMAFDSKGFFDAAEAKTRELEKALLACSNNGEYPVFCDTSPCLYRMRQQMDKRLALYEPVEFIHDFMMERLVFNKQPGTIALHVTCSATKLQLGEKFRAVAAACAEKVVVPTKVGCCGFAGNKGFDLPELNAVALIELKPALPKECAAGYSNSRTCEIGLSEHSGISYQSIVYLVDRCTEKPSATQRPSTHEPEEARSSIDTDTI
jgi:D-lactate dehydrogenase